VTLAQNSGRLEVSQFIHKPAEVLSGAFRQGQFQILPLKKAEGTQRGFALGRREWRWPAGLLVAQPDSGQSLFICNSRRVRWPSRVRFRHWPCGQIAAADWNADATGNFSLSQGENAVGVTQFDKNGRLPFPTLLPIDGKPLVMAVGALRPGAKPALAIIVDRNGQRFLVTRTADNKTRSQNSTKNSHPIRSDGRSRCQSGRLADLVC